MPYPSFTEAPLKHSFALMLPLYWKCTHKGRQNEAAWSPHRKWSCSHLGAVVDVPIRPMVHAYHWFLSLCGVILETQMSVTSCFGLKSAFLHHLHGKTSDITMLHAMRGLT